MLRLQRAPLSTEMVHMANIIPERLGPWLLRVSCTVGTSLPLSAAFWPVELVEAGAVREIALIGLSAI